MYQSESYDIAFSLGLAHFRINTWHRLTVIGNYTPYVLLSHITSSIIRHSDWIERTGSVIHVADIEAESCHGDNCQASPVHRRSQKSLLWPVFTSTWANALGSLLSSCLWWSSHSQATSTAKPFQRTQHYKSYSETHPSSFFVHIAHIAALLAKHRGWRFW